jgi:predicted phage terminase large subunit-like protein
MARPIIAPQAGVQEEFLASKADITLFGGAAGSGKSHCILIDPLEHINDPNFFCVFFRKTNVNLEASLWPEAKKLYNQFNTKKFKIKINEQKKTITWPSGARFKFDYMSLDRNADENHQGAQYTAVYWDEFTHYNYFQFEYLLTRLRSAAKIESYCKATMNPDRDHFVYDWVEPYLLLEDTFDQEGNAIEDKRTGCPDRSLCGRIRHFFMDGEKLVSYWTLEELLEDFPDKAAMVQTYTYIAGTIDDNPIMEEANPAYRRQLLNKSYINRQRLLFGNWHARPEGSGYFERAWCEMVTKPPAVAVRVRSWDTASTKPSDINPNPDWTAGVKMSKNPDGLYCVEDVKRIRERPAGVKAFLLETGMSDGTDTTVTVPLDPAAAGKYVAMEYIKMFVSNRITAFTMPTGKDKVTRFSPFSAAAEAGLISVVIGDWNDQFFQELEAFQGDGKGKDDQVDATADAFIKLGETRVLPVFSPALLTGMKNRFKF